MSKIAPPEELRRLVGVVEDKLAGLPPIQTGNLDSYADHRKAAEFALLALRKSDGARFNTKWDGCTLRLGGVSTSCTGGSAGALRNWVNAANRNLKDGETS